MKYLPATSVAPPPRSYRIPGGHTTRPIGNPQLVKEADTFDAAQRELRIAIEASKATAAGEVENRRTLEMAVQESLDLSSTSDFPNLPPVEKPDTSEKPPGADTTAEDDDGRSGASSHGLWSDSEDAEEQDVGGEVGDEFEMFDAGEEDAQF